MFGDLLEEMFEAEFDEKIAYSKYDYKNKKNNQ